MRANTLLEHRHIQRTLHQEKYQVQKCPRRGAKLRGRETGQGQATKKNPATHRQPHIHISAWAQISPSGFPDSKAHAYHQSTAGVRR